MALRSLPSKIDKYEHPSLSTMLGEDEVVQEVHTIMIPHIGSVPVLKGNIHLLPKNVQKFLIHWVQYFASFMHLILKMYTYNIKLNL